ncbi:MAG TPA: CoA-binding protein [Nitriliruptorales bacterium]
MSDRPTVDTILSYARRIAVVGLSSKPWRSSYQVAHMLHEQGYEIIPVNPNEHDVLGLKAYPSLAEIPGEPVDVVDVFRDVEHLPGIAEEVAAVGARAMWVQLGLRCPEAREIAESEGLDYVEDICLKIEVNRLSRHMNLPPELA